MVGGQGGAPSSVILESTGVGRSPGFGCLGRRFGGDGQSDQVVIYNESQAKWLTTGRCLSDCAEVEKAVTCVDKRWSHALSTRSIATKSVNGQLVWS